MNLLNLIKQKVVESINLTNKPQTNSLGQPIAKDSESLNNFYGWFGDSKMVDDMGRPMVFYHISPKEFTVFKSGVFGKMGEGIYFTSIKDDLKVHNKYGGSKIYECYLIIENPLVIDHPFAKRHDNNDGVIAGKGESGEEIKVYTPHQIKAINNDGSFDLDDQNMYS